MAHFAKLDENNIVTEVTVINNSVLNDNGTESEAKGIEFLKSLFGSDINWKQTSYNTVGNEHFLGGTPFRKNYAGIGYTYDAVKDAFISPKPYPSWTLNETTCVWDPPVAHPNDGPYSWNESTQSWDPI